MPCDTRRLNRMTRIQRKKQIDESVAALEKALATNVVTVKVSPKGAIAFVGNWNREEVSDVCAYRKLATAGSAALRAAVARAEVFAGRKIDPMAIASGEHSHDGGKTWGSH